jgi:SPP1 gp7 family putative phage head morphogenesis protein
LSVLLDTALAYKARLLERERLAALEMARAYQPAYLAIQQQLGRITQRIAEAQDAGEPLGRSWLFQQDRAASLTAQIEGAMRGFTPAAEAITRRNQREGIVMGKRDSQDLIALAQGLQPQLATRWDLLPTAAVEAQVGFAADGSPLHDLFNRIGPDMATGIRDDLARGLALGKNPNVIARQVRERSGMGLVRAVTISRTEMLRSYREAQREAYSRSDVVVGWIWLSARQVRTCAACWAMDGKKFPAEDSPEMHVRCRCTMVPDTGGTEIGNGIDEFEKLSPKQQERVLGPSKYKAYRDGEVTLEDLVARRDNRLWGASRSEASLVLAKKNALSRRQPLGIVGRRERQAIQKSMGKATTVADARKIQRARAAKLAEQLKDDPDVAALVGAHASDKIKGAEAMRDRLLKMARDSGDKEWEQKILASHAEKVKELLGDAPSLEERIDWLMTEWGHSSSLPAYVAWQRSIAAEFNLDIPDHLRRHRNWDASDADLASHGPAMRKLARQMYNNTQDELKSLNIERVTLYRGMNARGAIEEGTQRVVLENAPGSAYSTSYQRASRYATLTRDRSDPGAMIAHEVEASQVLSLSHNGIGNPYEREVVVLGGRSEAWVVNRADLPTNEADYWSAVDEARTAP